jgi:hypothetical protein
VGGAVGLGVGAGTVHPTNKNKPTNTTRADFMMVILTAWTGVSLSTFGVRFFTVWGLVPQHSLPSLRK